MATSKVDGGNIFKIDGRIIQSGTDYEEVYSLDVSGTAMFLLAVKANWWNVQPTGIRVVCTSDSPNVVIAESTGVNYRAMSCITLLVNGTYSIQIKTGSTGTNLEKAIRGIVVKQTF